MKNRLFSLTALCFFAIGAMAQNDPTLLTINGQEIKVSEFKYIYDKNHTASVDTLSLDEYLEMFINFKLKVMEAEANGIDTTQAFKDELKGYRAQATPKYMQDAEALDSLVRMSYNRMCLDRRAAHIAVECPKDAPDSVQQAALAKATALRQRVLNGEGFYDVAAQESSVKGDAELGWVTPFRFVYALEDAVFNTPVGGITPIFRSPYGYHFAWVEEEQPHAEVAAAHIMKMVPSADSIANINAKQKIDSIYMLAKSGADFAQLAKTQSDDKGSAMRGGDLGWFGRGMMVKAFEDVAFGMEPGTVSEPFRSRFGWHIIHKSAQRGVQPFDSIRAQIEKNVLRDERSKEADKSFIRKTRLEYNLPDSMSDEAVREYADSHLEEKYEEFRHLVQEYHDGILLFDISLDKVWDRASKDEEGLAQYFADNKANYTWDAPRWKGVVIYAKDAAHAKAAKKIVQTANPDSIQSYIASRVNTDSTKYVVVERGLWEQGKNMAIDQYGFRVKDAKYESETYPVVILLGKKIKVPVEYTDVRGQVINDYQDALEKVWIEELRQKYTVTINQPVFDSLR